MLQPLLEFYKTIEANKYRFTDKGLNETFFIDVYRSQPYEPEAYEYFSLPAIFVDYSMTGQGKGNPRVVTMTLHILTDEMPDTSNISNSKKEGLNKFLYNLLLQQILEGTRLGNTTPLKFISENAVEDAVTNYHTQTYEFEAYLNSMIEDIEPVFAAFESLNIYGSLRNRKILKDIFDPSFDITFQ